MLYEKITQSELDSMKREDGTYPNYTYEDYIINRNEETGEILEEYYTNLTIHMTADEVYEKWLADKDKPPTPNEMEVLKARLNEVENVNAGLLLEIEMLIDDLVFEVIPSIEQQVQQGVEGVTLNNMISRGSEGMVGCLARKIIEGRDYRTVFKTNAYKQYQDEVDTILELEGHAHLIKRDELGVL